MSDPAPSERFPSPEVDPGRYPRLAWMSSLLPDEPPDRELARLALLRRVGDLSFEAILNAAAKLNAAEIQVWFAGRSRPPVELLDAALLVAAAPWAPSPGVRVVRDAAGVARVVPAEGLSRAAHAVVSCYLALAAAVGLTDAHIDDELARVFESLTQHGNGPSAGSSPGPAAIPPSDLPDLSA